jgi:hypothetical protein
VYYGAKYYGAKYDCTTQENYLPNRWPTSLLYNRNFATSDGHKFCAQRRDFVREPSPHLTTLHVSVIDLLGTRRID